MRLLTRLALAVLFLLSAALPAMAQYTVVSSTGVTDSAGIVYNGGTYNINLVNSTGQPAYFQGAPLPTSLTLYAGTLSSAGAFSATIPSSAFILAGNGGPASQTTWNFTVCAKGGVSCYSVATAVSGASQNVTATINVGAVAMAFSLPGVPPGPTGNAIIANSSGGFGFGTSGSASFSGLTAGTNSNAGKFLWQQAGVFTSTQYNIFNEFALIDGAGSCPITASLNNTSALTACLNGPTTLDSAAVNSAIEAWATVNDPTQDSSNPGQANVAGFAFRGNSTCGASNTVCEGMYVTAQDTSSKTGQLIVGNEIDVSASAASTQGYGLELLSIGTQQLTANVLPAIYVQPFGAGTSKWTSGITCGAASIFVQTSSAPCMVLSLQTAGASKPSNTIQFITSDGSSTNHPLDILSNYNVNAAMPLLTSVQNYQQVLDAVWSNNINQVATNVAISGGWGTTASVAMCTVGGSLQRACYVITSSGTGQAANPTFTVTFPEHMAYTPICLAQQNGGTGAMAFISTGTPTTTGSGAFTWIGTPSTGLTYQIVVDCRL
jgi:hypothetical protein